MSNKIDNGNQPNYGLMFVVAVFVVLAIIGVVVIAIGLAKQIGVF